MTPTDPRAHVAITPGDPDRQHVGLRLSATKVAAYETLAIKHSRPGARLNRTDVIKAHLAVAERYETEVARLLDRIAEGRA